MMSGQRTGRIPDAVRSERIRIDGQRKRGVNARDDVTFAWLDSLAGGSRFGMAWELLTAALNGELGENVKKAVASGDTEEAVQALEEAMSVWIS